MSNNLFDKLGTLSHLITVVHHIPGRIRLKFNPAILKELGDEGLSELEGIKTQLEGIKDVKLNKMARSVTLQYDPKVLPASFFEALLQGERTPELERYWTKEET